MASGKLLLRMPVKVHEYLIEESERTGLSINTLIVQALLKEMGR
jgi:predicted HicB family RNase H-like nuclease